MFTKVFVDGYYGTDVLDTEDDNQKEKNEKNEEKAFFSSMYVKKGKKSPEDEIEKYFLLTRLEENCDPLNFWRDSTQSLPSLQKMAKDFLGIAGTSVMSESTFSEGRQLMNYNQSRTEWPTARSILCLRSWMRLSISSTKKNGSDSDTNSENDENDDDDDEW